MRLFVCDEATFGAKIENSRANSKKVVQQIADV